MSTNRRSIDTSPPTAAELATCFARWRRSRRSLGRALARAFGRELHDWVHAVATVVLPLDPDTARKLLERCITADGALFNRADDSDGTIGDAIRAACVHWLVAVSRTAVSPAQRRTKLLALYDADEHGARDPLLRRANVALTDDDLRLLVDVVERRLADAIASRAPGAAPGFHVFHHAGALSMLAEALRDPDVAVRATLMHSPNPNPLQRASFVRTYLTTGKPEGALRWVAAPWGEHEPQRVDLHARVLEALGRFAESAPLRQQLLEQSAQPDAYDAWLRYLPAPAAASARTRARAVALAHPDTITAARLLLHIGDADAAEAKLITDHDTLDGRRYDELLSVVDALHTSGYVRGASAVYRALLNSILTRAESQAYGFAARYWHLLAELASRRDSLAPLMEHAAFVAMVRQQHARKTAFWGRVGAG